MRRAVRFGLGAFVLLALLFLLWPETKPGPTGRWLAAAGLEPRFEQVEGVRVHYVEAGSGPAVVLLHGFASSIYTWKDVLPALALDRRVVALDFPGFGQSDQPANLSFGLYPRAVLGLMDRLRVERASLVGNSMGGAVAVVIAAREPDRVERLVLIDAAGYNTGPGETPWLIRLAGSKSLGAVVDHLPIRGRLVRLGLRQVFHDPSHVTAERFAEYSAPLLRPRAMTAIRSLLLGAGARPSMADLAPRVRVPTLVLWGREDRWIPVAHADRFAAAISGSRKVVLEACGHLPQEEQPEQVVRLLREFLGP